MDRPTAIISGDSYEWDVVSSDYPAPDWVLKVTIINATKRVQVTADANGADHTVTLNSTSTDDLTAGVYSVVESVERTVDTVLYRHTIASYSLTVTPNITGSTVATDVRSHARIVLDAIQATIEGRATLDQQQISIGGRTLVRMPIADLLKLKGDYQRLVDAEDAKSRAALGLATGRNINIRFA